MGKESWEVSDVGFGFDVASQALLVLLSVAKTAAVATPGDSIPIRVELDAPAGCSDADAFYAGVLARSSRARRAGAGEEAVRLVVRVTKTAGGARGELRVLDGRSESDTRKVEGARCDEVIEVLSLTAALAIDPGARLAVSPTAKPAPAPAAPGPPVPPLPPVVVPPPPPPVATEPPLETFPEPPPAPEPPPVEIVRPIPPPARVLGVAMSAQAVGAQVLSTSLNLGGAISLRLEGASTVGRGPSVALAFVYLSNDLFGEANDLMARWVAVGATACPGWSVGSTIVLEPCARGVGGWLTATGRGVTNPESVGRSWWSVGALLRASTELGGGFALEVEAGLTVPLVERRFKTTTPERMVGETPTLSAMVGVGIARRL